MNSILSIKELSKSYGDKLCLNKVSLSINRGDFIVLGGRNGSGKTLMLKFLKGLLKCPKETIFYNGEDIHKKRDILREKVGVIFQEANTQIIGLTVKEDLEFGLFNTGLNKGEVEKRVNSIANSLEITHLLKRNPHTLSGGEMKRVTIGSVLAMEPEIIVFDEPFTGLDYLGVVEVLTLIERLKEAGETIIVITHDLEKILKYPNRLVILDKGVKVWDGDVEGALESLNSWGIRRPIQSKIEDMTWK